MKLWNETNEGYHASQLCCSVITILGYSEKNLWEAELSINKSTYIDFLASKSDLAVSLFVMSWMKYPGMAWL